MDIFALVPVKLFFAIGLIYLSVKFYQDCRSRNHHFVFWSFLTSTILTIVLAVFSIGKLYPYGFVIDFAVGFLIAILLIWFESKIKHQTLRLIVVFITIFALSLMPLFYIQHFFLVGAVVNSDSFIAIFQTNFHEAIEYVTSFASPIMALGFFLFFYLIFRYSKKYIKKDKEAFSRNEILRYFVFLVLALLIVPNEKGFYTFPFITYASYAKELDTVKQRQKMFTNLSPPIETHAKKENKGETYILVIGESLNKHHMSSYGYKLETTPFLDKERNKDDTVFLDRAFANYPGTMAALSLAMTEANQYNKKKYADSVGIVQVFNDAGFNTIWLGNQPLSNSYDMVLGYIANHVNEKHLTFDRKFTTMSDSKQKPDGVLLPVLKDTFAKLDPSKNNVIFIHLMGSHTHYCKRYPAEFEKFKIPFTEKLWFNLVAGGTGHAQQCYDNSVLYNDYLIDKIQSQLKTFLGNDKSGGLMYFSDHSDDIARGIGHSSANFSYDMVEIPTIFWVSPEYKKQYLTKFKNLQNNSNKLFSNDLVFDSFIGFSGINLNAEHYCNKCDITNEAYTLSAEDARTMHGKLLYATDKNPFYKQKNNNQ